MVHGGLFSNITEYGVGIFNGTGRNISRNQDNNFLYAGRVMFTPFGKYEYSQAGLEYPHKPLLAIGLAVAGFSKFNPTTEGSSNRSNLGGAVLAIDPNIVEADVFQFTADIAFKYRGFTTEAEYDLRYISSDTGDNATGYGLRVQAGYFLIPERLDLAFRYAIVDPNDYKRDDKRQELTPALGFYFFKHRLKITADYSLLLGQNPSGGDFKDHRFRVQTEFYF